MEKKPVVPSTVPYPAVRWQQCCGAIAPDSRGAVITAPLVQIDSGDASTVYVRARIEAGANQEAGWLHVNTANQLDIWLNGYFQGTVAAEQYIWSDHLSASRRVGFTSHAAA